MEEKYGNLSEKIASDLADLPQKDYQSAYDKRMAKTNPKDRDALADAIYKENDKRVQMKKYNLKGK